MLNCTKNDSVRGSVPGLGKGAPGLAAFYSYSLQSISNVGKGWMLVISIFKKNFVVSSQRFYCF